jgi:hypothetical protein
VSLSTISAELKLPEAAHARQHPEKPVPLKKAEIWRPVLEESGSIVNTKEAGWVILGGWGGGTSEYFCVCNII